MNEDELDLVKECNFDNPVCSELNCILDTCYRNCLDNFFHKFKSEYIYDFNFKNIAKNEKIILTINGKNTDLYQLNKKLKVAPEKVFYLINSTN